MKPAVSVCIPAYRQPAFLARAIESVFTQDFQDFEVIVTDDSETDELLEVVSRWKDDDRLIYHRNENRLGSPGNWNAAMDLARAKLIKFLHHDDWFSGSTSLGRFVDAINSRPEVNFVFSAANACEDDGQLIFLHCPSPAQIALLKRSPLALQFGNFIGAPSATLFRKPSGFRFDTRLKWVVDIDAYLRLLGPYPRFEFIADPIVCISSNSAHQVSRDFERDTVSRLAEHLYLYSKHTPERLGERIDGLIFLSRLLSACSTQELDALSMDRKGDERTLEEKLIVSTLRLKSRLLTLAGVLSRAVRRTNVNQVSGRRSYAQCGEDMIVDHLLMWVGLNSISYLDIGAHHPTLFSNTYHFYRKGNRGVLIEPDEDLCKTLREKRPADKVLNLAVGVSGNNTINMYVMTSKTLNTLDKAQAEALQAAGRERIEDVRNVRQQVINEILAEHFGDNKPNFVSLDIEGLDFDILQAWDFDRFRPEVFCVETLTYSQSNAERRLTEIIDLMISRRYRVYADTYVNTIFVSEEAWLNRPVYA